MEIAPFPGNEQERLAALMEYKILDTATEEIFDHIAWLAAQICQVPISLISLMDKNRQWFKAAFGLPGLQETPRDLAFCSHTILGQDILEVPDAASDARFFDNPFVTEDPKIRFYAGAPLVTPGGYSIGTLCVIDREPKHLANHQKEMLRRLSKIIISLFEMKKVIQADFFRRQQSEKILQKTNTELEIQLDKQKHHQQNILLLSEMTAIFQSCVNVEEAYIIISKFCHQLFPNTSIDLYTLNADHTYVELAISSRKNGGGEDFFALSDCWALRRGQHHFASDVKQDLVCQHKKNKGELFLPYICLPLIAQGETLGLLSIEFNSLDEFSKSSVVVEDIQLLAAAVAEQVALALANIKLREMLHKQSICDPLTNLYNRRYLQEVMAREIPHASRKGKTFSVLMLDIDYFKKFNDSYGHDVGDLVLQQLADLLLKYARDTDVVCRLGGEEFLLFMRDMPLDLAIKRANQICEAARRIDMKYASQPTGLITVSIGVACFPEHGTTFEELMASADRGLYKAKNAGRNGVGVPDPLQQRRNSES